MNRYFCAISVCLFLFFMGSCRSKPQTAGQSGDSTALSTQAEPVSPDDIVITERLANLGLTADSDWRGVHLGDTFTMVNTSEKGEPFERDAEHIGYTIELKNLETVDVLYYQTDKKVSAIDVDLFLNSRQAVAGYQKDLIPYFTARYGVPKTGDGGSIWTGRRGETVTLNDVSKGKDFGLKIKIALRDGAATASAK